MRAISCMIEAHTAPMQTRISSCAVLMSFCLAGPALAEQAQSIFIEGDKVRGNTPKRQTGPTCVLNSQFKHAGRLT